MEPLLILGLGNPGKDYSLTRHNAGADYVDLLCSKYSLTLKKERQIHGQFAEFVNENYSFNPHIMFIAKKKITNDWFKSLFSWLFKCEKEFGFAKLKGYDQQRLYAYLAERYLSFWFKKNTRYLEWHWNFFELK